MKKPLLYCVTLLALLLFSAPSAAWAQSEFFVEAPDLRAATKGEKKVSAYRVFRLDMAGLKTYLANAPVEFTADRRPALRLAVPLPTGITETFAIYDSPILAPAVAAQYPDIKTYTGQSTATGSTATIRFSFTEAGFNAIVVGLPGAATAYFEKSTTAPGNNVYLSYSTLDLLRGPGAPAIKKNPCEVPSLGRSPRLGGASPVGARAQSSGGTLRTLRLAVAATGEFTNAKGTPGNTAAGGYAAVVQYVNRLVAVFRRELSVSFVLVSTASVVYPDPATDPFLTPTNNATVLPVSQAVLDASVGDANYDIGHTLGYGGASSGGGLAQSSSVCTTGSKAQAVSDVNEGTAGSTFPAVFGDQVFCHEVGHQVGMNHSYNSSIPVCTTRNPDTSVEPGSGTTIMSYGYTCADAIDPAKNDDYETGYLPFLNFHATNLAEANAFMATITCFTTTNTGNAVPVITSFTTGRTIPKSTPFALTATATDANAANVLSYSWEGLDTGGNAATPPGPTVLADEAQAPFFRSYEPVASSTRVFPRLPAILSGANKAKGDKLPSVSRVVNLRLTVRDNVDGVTEASSAITIDANSGPFLITSDLAGSYAGNTAQTVTWSVNNTTAAPVSCANVDILLSTDGGQTFPITLLMATPNDGTEAVTMPALATPTTTARLKVQASNNIFFDVSNTDFAITASLNSVSTGTIAGSPFCTGTAVSVPYTITGTYNAGNTFEAQLSNASGSFAAPVVIGTLSSVASSGTISAVIPAAAAAGSGYRIRVVASNPAVTGTDNGANLNVSAPAVATFGYGSASTFCTTQTAAQAAVAGAGATLGSFSASPATGLTLNATTGAITPSTSTPGTYTVTNTVAASGGCAAVPAMSTVTITAPAPAAFGYAAASYCTSATGSVAAVLATGSTAGTFASTAGLALDPTTGAITPSASTSGTYMVTNTLAASGVCAAVSATSTVVITAPQTAGFAYGATAYCTTATGTTAATMATGATAGAFTSTVGLTLNAATGAITASTSTSGTYIVTNTVAPSGGCAVVSAASTVTITAPATAGFGYAAASYCTTTTGTTAATLTTGATAGAFTSTTGLTLNATTGAIAPSTSTPGTYIVTNTVAASGGCAAVPAMSTITIAAPQSAAFAYPATANYCAGATNSLTPTLGAGAVAGTYDLANGTGTGATINAATGVVSIGAAAAGTFTVTNTVAASGGCAAVVATQTVTVQPLPAMPVLAVVGSNTVSVQGGAVAGITYQFLRGGVAVGPASAAASYQVMSAAGNGQYTVVATSAAGCASALSAAVTVGYLASAVGHGTGTELLLYPNPAPLGGWAAAELRGWTGAATLTLYDVLGRAVRVAPAAPTGTTRLNLAGLSAGVYWLRAQASGQQASRRLVVE